MEIIRILSVNVAPRLAHHSQTVLGIVGVAQLTLIGIGFVAHFRLPRHNWLGSRKCQLADVIRLPKGYQFGCFSASYLIADDGSYCGCVVAGKCIFP